MVTIKFNEKLKLEKDASVVFLTKEQVRSLKFNHFGSRAFRDQVSRLSRSKQFLAEQGEAFPIFPNKCLTLVVGLGEEAKLTKTSLCIAVKQAMESPYLKSVKAVNVFSHLNDEETIIGIIEGIQVGAYKWQKYVQQKKDEQGLSSVTIASAPKRRYAEQIKICDGVNYARDLVNDNADIVNSIFIENEIRHLTGAKKNIRAEILGEKDLKKKGLNLLLAVNKGSKYPPRLIIVKYNGLNKNSDYTAIVGKGITFDTGGLNLKSSGSIETMRSDMAGAAAVLGILKNAISLSIKKNILFVVVVAENAIGSEASKPGDVIKSYDGKTVEMANADAEGRLVLADALSYVVKNYKPKKVIDVATLTGACAVALGNDYSGLVSNDDKLAEKFLKLGQQTDDRLWRLPLYPELKNYLKSQYADLKSTGMPKGIGGAISGAEFLHQFVGDVPWVHLDIAGTAFAEAPGRLYFNYGATGVGVRALTQFLMDS